MSIDNVIKKNCKDLQIKLKLGSQDKDLLVDFMMSLKYGLEINKLYVGG